MAQESPQTILPADAQRRAPRQLWMELYEILGFDRIQRIDFELQRGTPPERALNTLNGVTLDAQVKPYAVAALAWRARGLADHSFHYCHARFN